MDFIQAPPFTQRNFYVNFDEHFHWPLYTPRGMRLSRSRVLYAARGTVLISDGDSDYEEQRSWTHTTGTSDTER